MNDFFEFLKAWWLPLLFLAFFFALRLVGYFLKDNSENGKNNQQKGGEKNGH